MQLIVHQKPSKTTTFFFVVKASLPIQASDLKSSDLKSWTFDPKPHFLEASHQGVQLQPIRVTMLGLHSGFDCLAWLCRSQSPSIYGPH